MVGGSKEDTGAQRARVVLLGASNLTQGLRIVLEESRARLGAPLDVCCALGRGRSYGIHSWFLIRRMMGIRESGLWEHLEESARGVDHALVTDVGSVKGGLAEALPGILPPGVRYVGSHPMAGSHASGLAFARADLFEGAACVVTPTAPDEGVLADRLADFWRALGSRVERRDPARHGGMIDPERPGRGRERAAARHGQHGAEIVRGQGHGFAPLPFGLCINAQKVRENESFRSIATLITLHLHPVAQTERTGR